MTDVDFSALIERELQSMDEQIQSILQDRLADGWMPVKLDVSLNIGNGKHDNAITQGVRDLAKKYDLYLFSSDLARGEHIGVFAFVTFQKGDSRTSKDGYITFSDEFKEYVLTAFPEYNDYYSLFTFIADRAQ